MCAWLSVGLWEVTDPVALQLCPSGGLRAGERSQRHKAVQFRIVPREAQRCQNFWQKIEKCERLAHSIHDWVRHVDRPSSTHRYRQDQNVSCTGPTRRYGVRPSSAQSFQDHLGRVRGTKSKIKDGYAEGTARPLCVAVGDFAGAQPLRVQVGWSWNLRTFCCSAQR